MPNKLLRKNYTLSSLHNAGEHICFPFLVGRRIPRCSVCLLKNRFFVVLLPLTICNAQTFIFSKVSRKFCYDLIWTKDGATDLFKLSYIFFTPSIRNQNIRNHLTIFNKWNIIFIFHLLNI